jgi:hypothetical protein
VSESQLALFTGDDFRGEWEGKRKDRMGMSELQPYEFARKKMLVFRGTPQYENISEPLKMLILTIQLNFTRLLLS